MSPAGGSPGETPEEGVGTLPCCSVIEQPDGTAYRCRGVMSSRWRVYVCDTCRGQCGILAHPTCSTHPLPDEPDRAWVDLDGKLPDSPAPHT